LRVLPWHPLGLPWLPGAPVLVLLFLLLSWASPTSFWSASSTGYAVYPAGFSL
jgi:hypothetical protein